MRKRTFQFAPGADADFPATAAASFLALREGLLSREQGGLLYLLEGGAVKLRSIFDEHLAEQDEMLIKHQAQSSQYISV